MAFETLDNAENVGYIIPTLVIQHFLHGVASCKSLQIASVDFDFQVPRASRELLKADLAQTIENSAMRSALKIPESNRDTGILILKVRGHGCPAQADGALQQPHAAGDSAKVLKEGDVLLAFDGVPIGSDATVAFRGSERVGFGALSMFCVRCSVVARLQNTWCRRSLWEIRQS